jgi:hypothetical protein
MKYQLYPVILLVLLAGAGCAPPVTVVTPQGQTAFRADAVVVRVNELMNAAIAANANAALSVDQTRTIVQFCVAADQTLAATPAGWPTTIRTAWASTKAQLPSVQNLVVVAAMGAVDVVLEGLQP